MITTNMWKNGTEGEYLGSLSEPGTVGDVEIGSLFSKSMQKADYVDSHTQRVSIWVLVYNEAIFKGSLALVDFVVEFELTGLVKPSSSITPMVHFFETEPWEPKMVIM
jgi:hypothetical protein